MGGNLFIGKHFTCAAEVIFAFCFFRLLLRFWGMNSMTSFVHSEGGVVAVGDGTSREILYLSTPGDGDYVVEMPRELRLCLIEN